MRRQLQAALRLTVIIVLSTTVISCTALRYRTIQDDFNRAVEMDNETFGLEAQEAARDAMREDARTRRSASEALLEGGEPCTPTEEP